MKKATKVEDKIKIQFYVKKEYFTPLLAFVKSIPNREWNPTQKAWYVPNTPQNVSLLASNGFDIDPALQNTLPERPRPTVMRAKEPSAPIDTKQLPSALRDYQLDAIRFLEAKGGNGLIALFPRAGKSSVALLYVKLHPEVKKTLIICPASAKIGWQREIKKWLNQDSLVLHGRTPFPIRNKHQFHIINWDILHDWEDLIIKNKYDLIILDEVHRGSNMSLKKKNAEGKYKTVPVKCTAALQNIAKNCPRNIALSGTPITSRVSQLFVLLNLYAPEQFPDYYKFLWRYCDPQHSGFGWEFKGISNEDELLPVLPLYMFRRRREEVIEQLPEESHEFVPIEIDRVAYEQDLAEFGKWLKKNPNCTEEQQDTQMARFESISYSKKRQQIIEWIKDYVETGNKIVLFTHHRQVSEDIHNVFKKKAVLLYGGMTPEKKQQAIDKFNEDDKTQIFVGNIDACKEAISLYASDVVAYIEIPSVVGALDQSRQRIYLPEKGDHKFTYLYFVAEDTVDMDRVQNLIKRGKIIDTVIDGKEYDMFS